VSPDGRHVAIGEIEDVKAQVPESIRRIWPETAIAKARTTPAHNASPEDAPLEGPIPTVAFVSLWTGLLVAQFAFHNRKWRDLCFLMWCRSP
jgi:hypothetical protein